MKLISFKTVKMSLCWLACIMLSASSLFAQSKRVSGRVSDEQGELLIGVTVQEKGTSNGVMTDLDGQYTLNLTTSNPVLVVSCIGYKTQEIAVGNRKLVDVALAEDISELEEIVVVTAFEGNHKGMLNRERVVTLNIRGTTVTGSLVDQVGFGNKINYTRPILNTAANLYGSRNRCKTRN